jgi:Na+-transporting methylmalonyl-CoA/oxaloacetate decarboxylase gamma subunit
MRLVFGVLSILFAVAVVGFLMKKQLSATPALMVPVTAASGPGATPRQIQAQQAQDEIRQAMEAAMKQPREQSEEPKP